MKQIKAINWRLLLVMWLLTLMVLPLMPFAVLASNITNANFYGVITISNNGTATTNVYTTGNLTTSNFINGGFVNSTATNIVVRNTSGTDIAFMPGWSTNEWCFYVPSIGASSYLSYLMYVGDVSGGEIAYFPANGGMTRADNALLEPAANFTISQFGYTNMAATGTEYLIYKAGAFATVYSDDEEITSAILNVESSQETQAGGASDIGVYSTTYLSQTFTPAVTHILNRVEIIGGVNVGAPPAGDITLSIRTAAANFPTGSDLTSDSITFATWNSGGGVNNFVFDTPIYVDAGTQYAIVLKYPNGTAVNYVTWRENNAGAYAGGIAGTSADSGNTWAGVGGGAAYDASFTEYGYTFACDVTAAGVTSNEHAILTTADSVDLKIFIDGTEEDTQALGGASVPNNGNTWYFLQNGAMPYMLGHNITIGGNLRQQIVWAYNSTLPDLSGNGMDATPTFRTSSSDADVDAYLSSFQPVEESKAPGYATTISEAGFLGAPNITGNFSTTVNATFPGASIFTAIATAGQVPAQLPLILSISFGILAMSLLISFLMRKHGSSSLFVKSGVIFALMCFAVGTKAFDVWMVLFFALIAIALVMGSRQQTWA